MKPYHVKKIKNLSWVLFCSYLVVMAYLLFFSEYLNRNGTREYRYNLVFFQEVNRSFWCLRHGQPSYFLLNFVMNIVAFVPFGFFLPLLSRNRHGKNIFYVMFSALEFTLVIEIVQLVLRVGTFDVDDIMLNSIGGFIGYLLFIIMYLFYKLLRKVMK